MNVIFCDFDDVEWVPVLKKISELKKFKNIHIIDRKKFIIESKKNFNKIFTVDMENAILNNFDTNKIKNDRFDKEYFSKNFKISSEMLRRFDPLNSLSNKEKKIEYYKSIKFWHNYLLKNKISLFFSKTTPHQFYDYVIYLCCKHLKIKTVFFGLSYFHDYSYLIEDIKKRDNFRIWKKNNISNKKIFFSLQKKLKKNFNISKPKYIKDIEYNNFTYLKYVVLGVFKLFYVIITLKLFNKPNDTIFYPKSKKNIIYKTLIFEKILNIRSVIKKFFMLQFYKKNSEEIDTNKNYVFFANQFQPESTNCPEGGNYSDTIKTLNILSKTLGKNFYIFYKEHPLTFNPNPLYLSDRIKNVKFYEKLKKIKNIKFLNLNSDTYKLIDHAKFTATVAGQIGFECILKNQKCVVFSRIWYSSSKFILNYTEKNFKNKLNKFLNTKIDNDNFLKTFDVFLKSSINSKAIRKPSVLKLKKEVSKNVDYILKYI